MKINSDKTSFQSGLTKQIIQKTKKININLSKITLYNNYNIDAFFMNDRSSCFCNITAANLFNILSSKLNFPIFYPPSIKCYSSKPIFSTNDNFCIANDAKVFEKELPFEARSIFFKKQDSIEKINENIEKRYVNKENSSSHFLADTIHEWIHSIHIGYLLKKYGKYNAMEKIKQLNNLNLTSQEKSMFSDIIGSYAINTKNIALEIVAETFTQIICKSLHPQKIELDKNPLDLLKKYPREYNKLLIQILRY